MLALAFFFEYAFENRWITESGRVLLGLACGAAAFGAGEYFFRRRQRSYGQAMAAAGVAFFYLSLWAAFSLYHLVPQLAALSLMVLTTAAAGFLAARYDSPAVAQPYDARDVRVSAQNQRRREPLGLGLDILDRACVNDGVIGHALEPIGRVIARCRVTEKHVFAIDHRRRQAAEPIKMGALELPVVGASGCTGPVTSAR